MPTSTVTLTCDVCGEWLDLDLDAVVGDVEIALFVAVHAPHELLRITSVRTLTPCRCPSAPTSKTTSRSSTTGSAHTSRPSAR